MFACQDHAESELFGEGRLCRIAYSQAARAFGIRSPHTVIMRSRRDRWLIPKPGRRACAAVTSFVTEATQLPPEQSRDCNEMTIAQSGRQERSAHNVSIGMALINYRLEHIHLFEETNDSARCWPDSPRPFSSITLRACRSAKNQNRGLESHENLPQASRDMHSRLTL